MGSASIFLKTETNIWVAWTEVTFFELKVVFIFVLFSDVSFEEVLMLDAYTFWWLVILILI